MLKQSGSSVIKTKKDIANAYTLKHTVRNLRAKVQSLLPEVNCEKIQKRNNRLRRQIKKFNIINAQIPTLSRASSMGDWRLSYRKDGFQHYLQQNQFQKNITGTNNFKISDNFKSISRQKNSANIFHKRNNSYQPQFKKFQSEICLKKYHFQKLSDEQIEQIQQHKTYYLGDEKHIQAYNKFIQRRNIKIQKNRKLKKHNSTYCQTKKSLLDSTSRNNSKQNQKNCYDEVNNKISFKKFVSQAISDIFNYSQNINIDQNNNQNYNYLKNNQKIKQILQQNQISFKNNKIYNQFYDQNGLNIFKKKIYQQQQIKQIMLNMQIKSKLLKGQQNFIKMKKLKKQQVVNENKKQEIKILTAQNKKRKILNQAGQIVDLTQKLRKRCLKKKVHALQSQQNLRNKIITSNFSNW